MKLSRDPQREMVSTEDKKAIDKPYQHEMEGQGRSAITATIGFGVRSREICFSSLHAKTEMERIFLESCLEKAMRKKSFRRMLDHDVSRRQQ